jgi:putative transposase
MACIWVILKLILYRNRQCVTSIDLFSRQVVGCSIDDHLRTSLCINALQLAFWRRKPEPGLVHHSDRGSQYASHEYRSHLGVMKMQQSMSRKKVTVGA